MRPATVTVPLLKIKKIFFLSQATKAQRHLLSVNGNMEHTSAEKTAHGTVQNSVIIMFQFSYKKTRDVRNAVLS
jgi:hypothetical protein